MFFPKEIWSKIFEYDNTIYADCLCDIQQNKIVNYYTRIKRHPISRGWDPTGPHFGGDSTLFNLLAYSIIK